MPPTSANDIPWRSTGRKTVASRVVESILPIGVLPRGMKDLQGVNQRQLTPEEIESRKYIMRILGSAVYVGDRKLLAPRIILDDARRTGSTVYVLRTRVNGDQRIHFAIPVTHFVPYIDPRTNAPNTDVDAMLTLLLFTPEGFDEPRAIHWGDSRDLGSGDSVLVAGYPMGSDLFFEHRSNRGVVQATIYSATIASIVPAVTDTETRLLRLTIPELGGLSGGIVFNPKNGTALGMLVSGTHAGVVPQPVLYAIPSEALYSFSKTNISVK
jgi:hypothetical protein